MVGAVCSDLLGAVCSEEVGALSSGQMGAVTTEFPHTAHKFCAEFQGSCYYQPVPL